MLTKKSFWHFTVFLTFFALYYIILSILIEEKNYIDLNLLFFAEKAKLAREGMPPRLENIGFVYPPLVFLFFLIFKNIPTAVAFLSASINTLFLFTVQRKFSLYLSMLFLFSFLYLFLSTQMPSLLLFYMFLTLTVIFIIRFIEEKLSLYLFFAGFLYGFSFFVDFRTVFLIPFWTLFFVFLIRTENWKEKIAIMTVFNTPIFFFSLSWMYLNWVFMGDPLNFIHSNYSYFKSFPSSSILKISFPLIIFYFFPFIFPYVFGFFYLKNKIYKFLYLLPVYTFFIFLKLKMIEGFFVNAVLFNIFFMLFYSEVKKLKFVFLITIIFSFVLIPFSPDYNERTFARAILGMKIEENLVEYKKVADFINTHSNGHILMDDSWGFPIVYFSKDTKRFILPYMYEFYSAVASPQLFAKWIIVNIDSESDKVLNSLPELKSKKSIYYYPVYKDKEIKIYMRLNNE